MEARQEDKYLLGRQADQWVRQGLGPFGQTVICEPPPQYDIICQRFPAVRGAAVIFSYGDKVYNPASIRVPYEILSHEAIHADQQESYGSVERWWAEYLVDREFRLQQEFEAHMVEWSHLKEWAVNRHARRAGEALISRKLASNIYDFGIDRLDMRRAMRLGECPTVGTWES